MSKVKIVSKNRALFGKEVNIPVDGKVKISDTGELTVSEEAAEILVNNSQQYSYIDENTSKRPTEDEQDEDKDTKPLDSLDEDEDDDDTGSGPTPPPGLDDEEDDDNDEEDDEDDDDNDEDDGGKENQQNEELTEESLMELTLKEMKEMAKDAGYPKSEYAKFSTKKLMAKYLVKKAK